MSNLVITLTLAFIGGFLPAIIWLSFWLRKDKAHPEPNRLLIKTFVYGMLAVPIVFTVQSLFNFSILGGRHEEFTQSAGFITFLVIATWALIEEFAKYIAARNGGLRSKANDEPLDVPIYMITAALGFAAVENALFLLLPIIDGDLNLAFYTGNLRFIGATLVHVASSAAIGIFGSFSYFLSNRIKRVYLFIGFVVATSLHAVFNLFIINSSQSAPLGFVTVWIFTVLLVVVFERIKKIHLNKIR
jgi:protease PrsW